jgi:hypothetical protein
MRDEIIARTLFTDGTWRNVYEQPDGRQYVIDDNAEQVFGAWYIPPEVPLPIVVPARESKR